MNWNLQNLRGTRDAVKVKLNGEQIPAEVKSFIASRIDAQPPDAIAIVLNAYSQNVVQPRALKVTENIQISIDSIRV
jgi:hypothetical protein